MAKITKDSHYKRYLEAQICCTEQFVIPHSYQEKAAHHQSEQLSRNSLGNNIRLTIFQQFIKGQQIKSKQEKKNVFTRQSVSALNKKQRDIRKNNYHLTQKGTSKECQLQSNNMLIAKEASFSQVNFKEKRPCSSASTRYFRQNNSKEYLQRAGTARPSTSLTRYSNTSGSVSFKKQQQFRLKNPLVIYPFESHMKSKRIDDNPKVLANIISKKHKIMQKQELYDFVCRLMNRRAK